MTQSFDASDLTAYIATVTEESDTQIERGKQLPKDIKMMLDTVEVEDGAVLGDLEKAKTSIDGQGKTLGAMLESLGGRVGNVGAEIKTFMDRSIAATGDGVNKLGGDVYKVESSKELGTLTDGLSIASDGAPKGPPRL